MAFGHLKNSVVTETQKGLFEVEILVEWTDQFVEELQGGLDRWARLSPCCIAGANSCRNQRDIHIRDSPLKHYRPMVPRLHQHRWKYR